MSDDETNTTNHKKDVESKAGTAVEQPAPGEETVEEEETIEEEETLEEEEAVEDAVEEERSYIFEERLQRGSELRAEGNELFGAGDLDGAMCLYRRALHHAEFEEMSYNFELQDMHRGMVDKEVHPIKLNMAAVLLKQGNFPKAVQRCDEVLSQNPDSTKALYRRAKANVERGWCDEAKADLAKCQATDPAVRTLFKEISKLSKVDQSRQKELWNNSLGKNANIEASEHLKTALGGDTVETPKASSSWCTLL